MIGQATARLESGRARWLARCWGIASIDIRQKWRVMRQYLRDLPAGGVVLVDAGCGAGRWALELAARRPRWKLIGVDRSEELIRQATSDGRALRLDNVQFVTADFLSYQPPQPVDVVLSVASVHYHVEEGRGQEAFEQVASWLKPGGVVLLWAPRSHREVPSMQWLPAPFRPREVIAFGALPDLLAGTELHIEALEPTVGQFGTVVKQLRRALAHRPVMRLASYPIQIALDVLDRIHSNHGGDGRSSALVLVARRSARVAVKPRTPRCRRLPVSNGWIGADPRPPAPEVDP